MKKRRKNPHAVALGRLGGSVRSEAKQRANRENGRKGGLVKSRKKRIAARRNARRPRPGRSKKSSKSSSLRSAGGLDRSPWRSAILGSDIPQPPAVDGERIDARAFDFTIGGATRSGISCPFSVRAGSA
jgi:hypothetical protein